MVVKLTYGAGAGIGQLLPRAQLSSIRIQSSSSYDGRSRTGRKVFGLRGLAMATAREGTRVVVRSPEERNGYPGSSLNLGALLSPTVADM